MSPELAAELPALLAHVDAGRLVQLTHRTRRNVDELECFVAHKWAPDDPLRQACRRLVRHLVDTPDIDWPEPLRPQ